MHNIGKFIVIEGLEGAGKSTAVQTVMALLNKAGIAVLNTREPGGTAVGELLRSIIKNPEYKEILMDKSELLLLYTARMQLIEEVIKPALAQGTWVVADRFELSTFAYQGGGRGLDPTMLEMLSAFCLEGFKPDLTLYLNIPPELGLQRIKQRGELDRIEQQSLAFFQRVHSAYLDFLSDDANVVKIDATQPLDSVQLAINQTLMHYLDE